MCLALNLYSSPTFDFLLHFALNATTGYRPQQGIYLLPTRLARVSDPLGLEPGSLDLHLDIGEY